MPSSHPLGHHLLLSFWGSFSPNRQPQTEAEVVMASFSMSAFHRMLGFHWSKDLSAETQCSPLSEGGLMVTTSLEFWDTVRGLGLVLAPFQPLASVHFLWNYLVFIISLYFHLSFILAQNCRPEPSFTASSHYTAIFQQSATLGDSLLLYLWPFLTTSILSLPKEGIKYTGWHWVLLTNESSSEPVTQTKEEWNDSARSPPLCLRGHCKCVPLADMSSHNHK